MSLWCNLTDWANILTAAGFCMAGESGAPHPDITVGVHGGQVQWTLGNPFPIRVCDYDGASDEDLPDIDERGERCRMWWEPTDLTSKV